MASRRFHGGPRDAQVERIYTPVPSRKVPHYDTADGFYGVCDDEQVINLVGHYYRRVAQHWRPGRVWEYDWRQL